MTTLTAAAVIAALVLIYRTWSRWPLDIIGVFCLDVMLFYGFRVVVVALGLDTVYPDYLFAGPPPAARANLVILLFLACVALGLYLGGTTSARAIWIFPRFRGRLSVRRSYGLALAITALATLITGALMMKYGGFSGLIRAAKLQRQLAGLYFLRVIPGMGAVVGSALFLEVIRRRGERRSRSEMWMGAAGGAMALLNGVWVFAWGARSLLAIVVFILLAGWVVFGPAARRTPRHRAGRGDSRQRTRIGALLIVLGVVAGCIVGLRVVRDLTTRGVVNSTIANQSLVRQVSVASNATYYDAVVLSVRDWPHLYQYRGGKDFYLGLAGVVPRALWPGKPAETLPGGWFRQVYEPTVVNGWPMGSAGEWYLNFGLAGVAGGGILSGICLSFAERSLRRSRTSPMVFVTTAIVGLQVLEIGFNSQTVLRWASWCLPILCLSPLLREPGRSARRPGRAAPVPAAKT